MKRGADKRKISALLEIAKKRLAFARLAQKLDPEQNFVFELIYESLLETLHAYLALQGITILNHLCIACYINEEMRRPDLAEAFDKARFLRNRIVYYGDSLSRTQCVEQTVACKKLQKAIEQLIKAAN